MIDGMQDDLSLYPGIDFNFSQPITDNVEEAASGVKGSIAVSIRQRRYKSEKIAVRNRQNTRYRARYRRLGCHRNIRQPGTAY